MRPKFWGAAKKLRLRLRGVFLVVSPTIGESALYPNGDNSPAREVGAHLCPPGSLLTQSVAVEPMLDRRV
jgi:hypothetical protein